MKKSAISAKIMLATMAMSIVTMTACGNGSGDESEGQKDSTTKTTTVKPDDKGFVAQTNIRYIERDTIMEKYTFAQTTLEQCQKIALELQQYQNELARKLQQKQAAIQQKVQSNGYLSEASYNADLQELQKADQQSQAAYAKRAQTDNDRINALTKIVTDSIENFIIRYNKTHKYDAILFRDAGLYFNPQLNITDDIVKGLNAEYKK